MKFQDKVIFARVQLNISQEKLGILLNLSLATISRWETGKCRPTRKDELLFNELCKKMNIIFDEEIKK